MIPDKLIKLMRRAQHVTVFTGAGVSAESGIPTFRDAMTGLWEKFRAEDLATREAFQRDAALVWGWYEWRRRMVAAARPNPAHLAIARLGQLCPRLTVITQNVDDLHERAGSADVIHLHGSLHAPRCYACHAPYEAAQDSQDQGALKERMSPPECPRCSGPVRPGVVWFGEELPARSLAAAFQAAAECDVLLSIGTSGIVHPAARIPVQAQQHGAIVVEINPMPTQSIRHYMLPGKAGELLPRLVDQVFGPYNQCAEAQKP